jgi:hypothetical protein
MLISSDVHNSLNGGEPSMNEQRPKPNQKQNPRTVGDPDTDTDIGNDQRDPDRGDAPRNDRERSGSTGKQYRT